MLLCGPDPHHVRRRAAHGCHSLRCPDPFPLPRPLPPQRAGLARWCLPSPCPGARNRRPVRACLRRRGGVPAGEPLLVRKLGQVRLPGLVLPVLSGLRRRMLRGRMHCGRYAPKEKPAQEAQEAALTGRRSHLRRTRRPGDRALADEIYRLLASTPIVMRRRGNFVSHRPVVAFSPGDDVAHVSFRRQRLSRYTQRHDVAFSASIPWRRS